MESTFKYRDIQSNTLISRKITKPFGNTMFITLFIRWSWIIFSISSILQLFLSYEIENIIAIIIVGVSWLIVTKYYLRYYIIKYYTFSSLLVIGFVATQLYFPLLFTLLEGKPVIYNLRLPVQVFSHSILATLILTLSHFFYRLIQIRPILKIRYLLVKAGFFTPPRDSQLWLMGSLGLLSMFYIYFYSPSVNREVTGAFDKTIQGFIPLTYAPYFLLFGQLYGGNKAQEKEKFFRLLIFTILLFMVSVGGNSRGAFMLGFTSFGFSYILGLFVGILKPYFFSKKNLIIGIFCIWVFTGPLADLGTAMVLVRGQRNNISRLELLKLTWETIKDKNAINYYRQGLTNNLNTWDEKYLDNVYLARFANIKYNDASLMDASKISDSDSDMFNYSMDRVLAILPDPIIRGLSLNVDKMAVTSSSFGDYLHYKSGAGASVLGGFRTGHLAGSGMATFGWWYLIILGLTIIPIYLLFDSLLLPSRNESKQNRFNIRYSLCGLLSLTSIVLFLPSESVVTPILYLMRGWIQMILIYYVIFRLTRLIIVR